MLFRKIVMPVSWRPDAARLVALTLAAGLTALTSQASTFFEGFDQPGRPADRPGITWSYQAELSPVKDWQDLIPGDGFAYLSVERSVLDRGKKRGKSWPFQTLSFGPVGPGHRLSMRAKNTAILGVAAMIFTYREQETIDEIDLEITATDTESRRPHHPTGSEGGWTDLRMATWIAADKQKPEPTTLIKQPARDAEGDPLSLQDDRFHIYSIEWDTNEVRFFIDDVLQHTIEDSVPDRPARVIIGLRQMPWAGPAEWEEPQTMIVDWVSVEPLE